MSLDQVQLELWLKVAQHPMQVRVQGWAKEWSIGCVNSRPVARGSQEAGFTQPREHLLADPCTHIYE